MRGNHSSRIPCFLLLCIHRIFVTVLYAETTTTQDTRCTFDWNVTTIDQQTLRVAWSGRGDGNVTVFITDSCLRSSCSQVSVTANFSEKRVELKPWSNNSKYDVEITYSCLYSNEKLRNKTMWTPTTLPGTPKVILEETQNTSFTVFWTLPNDYRGPSPTFTLWWEPSEISNVSNTLENIETNWYKITELIPYTYYQVKVMSWIRGDHSQWSRSLLVLTDIGVPSVPKNLSLESYPEDTVVKLIWNHPCYPNAREIKYKIMWNSSTEGIKSNYTKNIRPGNRIVNYAISNLMPYTNYTARVAAISDVGQGPWTSFISFQTAAGVPSIPRNFSLESNPEDTVVKLVWNHPLHPNAPEIKYKIMWNTSTEEIQSNYTDDMVPGKRFVNHTISSLIPYTNYSARVSAITAAGQGAWTTFIYFRTAVGVPSVPKNFALETYPEGTVVKLIWNHPYYPNAPKIKYKVMWNTSTEEIKSNYTENMVPGKHIVHYAISNLIPYTNYTARVTAISDVGQGPWTSFISFRTDARDFSHMVIPMIVTAAVLLLLGVLVAVGCRMKRKFYLDETKEAIQLSGVCNDQSLVVSELEMEECSSSRQSRRCSSHSLAVSEQDMDQNPLLRTIKCKHFDLYIRIMMSEHHLKFSQEFEMLKNESPNLPCTVAEMDINSSKNRWKDLLPFDHSRVKLLPLCDVPGSDFINANYIPGFSYRREYIGSQGPLPNTVDDFWRMIWEQSVSMVVMLTQCVERDVKAYKQKCEQYWPDSGESSLYCDLRVTSVSESIHPSYVIREFHLQLDSYDRQVKQMHFTHWPDFGSPECPEDLINFVKAVRNNLPREDIGPILVHCSAGVGRTGTYIVVDRLSQQLQVASTFPGNDAVNIYATVMELRNHRTNMVQTEDQYIYVHLCVSQLIRDREEFRQEECEEVAISNTAV